MKFPRILLAFAALLIACAIEMGCGGPAGPQSQVRQPPPPPTGTNYTTCNSQQVPNWQSNLFISNYQPAISAMVAHYGNNSNVGYIRIGLGRGGEINLPQGWNDSSANDACYGGYSGKWGYTVGGNSPTSSTWNTYLNTMVTYEGGLSSAAPLLVSITPISGASPSTVTDDFIAPIAVNNGMSFGNQGLESSDISGYPSCGGDWCNLFAKWHPQIAELQTLGQSCPNGTSCANSLAQSTGDLTPLLPFATSNGANDLELYYQDWLIAFDPDYANSIGVSSAEQTAYQAAIKTAAALPGVTLQVLFPPAPGDTTACGSTTCYQAIQTYLVNNPYVSGFVVDVDWSDFDLPNGSNNGHGSYSFSVSDSTVGAWSFPPKKVNLVLQNTTYGGSGSCPVSGTGSNGNVASNCAMPAWMWTVLQ